MKRFCLPLLFVLGACNAGKFYDKEYTFYDSAERRREREELSELRRKVAEYEETEGQAAAGSPEAADGGKVDEAVAKPESRPTTRRDEIETELDQLTAKIRKGEDSDGSLSRRRSELEAELVALSRAASKDQR